MTKIPYIDETLNCVLGCSKCSPACENCWAVKTVDRLWLCTVKEKYREVCHLEEWTGKVVIDSSAFDKCRRKKPSTYLLSSLGEWLHESLTIGQCRSLLAIMANYPQHRFYTLTKRPQRWKELGPIPPNVWLGASVWDQESYDRTEQYQKELEYPCSDWLSMEPLLGPIDISYRGWLVDWIVIGCESGKNRRPCNIEWIRSIVRQCKEYRIPCFVKQIDLNSKVGRDPAEWPEDLRVQEIPQ